MQRLTDKAAQPFPSDRIHIDTLLWTFEALMTTVNSQSRKQPGERTLTSARQINAEQDHPQLIIVDADHRRAKAYARQLSHFGYQSRLLGELEALPAQLHHAAPDAVIIDLSLCDKASDALFDMLHVGRIVPLPLIGIIPQADFTTRLAAVQRGIHAVLSTPVNIGLLVDTLDRLTERYRRDPYRVLIVDYGLLPAADYVTPLADAGILAMWVADPAAAFSLLLEFQPDLVLMPRRLPGYDGLTLATTFRQQVGFHNLPVIFLAVRDDGRDHTLDMIDDIIMLPLPDDSLVHAVAGRIRQARVLRDQMLRDSLTGLLNHRAFKEQLSRELARERRYPAVLTLALLNLDHFRLVNETYGAAAADQVLISLAHMLQQRLRASDIVGRYGSKEFAVIMPKTDGLAAVAVLDVIRTAFSQIQHQAADVTFSVTFSGGVASLASLGDAESLLATAGTALALAKQCGRNQLFLAAADELPSLLPTADAAVALPTGGEPAPSSSIWSQNIELPPSVLIVDDDVDVSTLLHDALSAAGYATTTVRSGAMALALLQEGPPPDLLLLDMQLPGMSGLEVLDIVRARSLDVGVIMTTTAASEQLVVAAIRRGVDDYLRKPLDLGEVELALARVLEKLRQRRQHVAHQEQLDAKRQLLEMDLTRAAQVQADLLPRVVPALAGFALAARCVPAREVGGDFYDWHVPTAGLLNLTFGDVMGKGMSAALLMTTVRAVMRTAARQTSPLVNIGYALGALVPDLDYADSFVTLFHAQLDVARRRLAYVDAGHGLAFVRRACGRIDLLAPRGVPIGAPTDTPYAEGAITFAPGDALVLFSDGLLDTWPALARNPVALFDLLDGCSSAQAIVDRILALPALLGPISDDLTVVVLTCYE